MAKVFLKKKDGEFSDQIYLLSPAEVFGSLGGNEQVLISDVSMLSANQKVVVDANVDVLILKGTASDYKFSASGNLVSIYKVGSSDEVIATIIPQDDNDGSIIYFSTDLRPFGSVQTSLTFAAKTGGGFEIKLGNQVLSSDSFTTFTPPVTEAPTEAPTEPVTEAPTEAPTEPVTEAPTEAPTEPVTEAPTEAVTEAPTEAPERVDVSLDSPPGTPQSARVIDAKDGACLFGDDVLQTSFTRIENFGADDAILFANLANKKIAVSNNGADVDIQVNDGNGHVSVISRP